MSRKKIASARDLETFLQTTIEDPVRFIIERLTSDLNIGREFDTGAGITSENNPSALSDIAKEVVATRLASQPTPPAPSTSPDALPDITRLCADQICVYRNDNGST